MTHDTKEANRARQQRHRDKVRAVTTAATHVRATAKVRATVQCTKCNGGVVCSDCARVREEVFAAFSLTVNRATYLNRQRVVTGGYNAKKADAVLATGELAQHGKGPRFTGRPGQKDILQVCAEECVQTEQTNRQGAPRDPLLQLWWDHMQFTRATAVLRKKLPNASPIKIIKLLMLTPEGKRIWRKLQGGAPAADGTQRNETLDDLLK
jgi:hypothetical protein